MSATAIMSAFSASLRSFASTAGVSVAVENEIFTPSGTSPYLLGFHLPAPTRAAGLGETAYNMHRGTFQVNVVYEADRGWGPATDMAERLRKHFKRGKKLASDAVTIASATPRPGVRSEGRWIVPVDVAYWAVISND